MTWEDFDNINDMVVFIDDKLDEIESEGDLESLWGIFDLLDSVPFPNNALAALYDRALDIQYRLDE